MKKKLSLLFLVTMFTLLFATFVSAATTEKVTNVRQTGATATKITVSFDTILGTNYYTVQMSEDAKNWVSITNYATNGEYTVTAGVSAGKSYYLRVAAKDSYVYSDAIQVTTCPAEITDLKQTGATTSSITISWSKIAGATAYKVCRFANGSEYVIATTINNSYTITGLKNNIVFPYDVYVKPIRNIGTYTAEQKVEYSYQVDHIDSADVRLVPGKVQNVHGEYYYSSLKKVTFDFDKIEHGSGYAYELCNYKGKKITSGTCSPNGYNELKNIKIGQFYRVRVRAYTTVNNKVLYGAWSDYCAFAQQPKVNIKRSGSKLKFSWKKVKGAKDYTVYVSTKQRSGYKKVATTKKTKYTLKKFKKKKLNKKKTYYVYVVANTKVGKKKFKSNAENCWYLARVIRY